MINFFIDFIVTSLALSSSVSIGLVLSILGLVLSILGLVLSILGLVFRFLG
jgi:hypothetical protein